MVGCGAEWLSMVRQVWQGVVRFGVVRFGAVGYCSVRQVRWGQVRIGGVRWCMVQYGAAGTDAPTLQVLSERGEDDHG